MGKLVTEDNLIKNNIEQYLDRATSEYTKFLETTPNFVTYYQRDRLESSYDYGLENVEKHIGKDSPNKFNKIENFPLYGIDSITLSLDRGEMGLDTVFDGEAIILPNTLRPAPDDFFTFGYINDVYIFRITSIQNDSIKNSPFYRITFMLTKKVPKDEYVDEFVSTEWVSIFDNIGSQYDSVIRKSDYIVVEYIDKLLESYIEEYTTDFYNRYLNIIEVPFRGRSIYNRYLNKFITQNKLFKTEKTIMKDFFLVDIIKGKSISFEQSYKYSLYHAIEKRDRHQHICDRALMFKIGLENTIFAHFGKEEYELLLSDKTNLQFQVFPLFNPELIQKINAKEYEPFDDDKRFFIENIILDYMWDKLEINIEFLDKLNDFDWLGGYKSYSYLPLIMFILKQYRNKIIINIDKKLIIQR